jgi:hypothetical protein
MNFRIASMLCCFVCGCSGSPGAPPAPDAGQDVWTEYFPCDAAVAWEPYDAGPNGCVALGYNAAAWIDCTGLVVCTDGPQPR